FEPDAAQRVALAEFNGLGGLLLAPLQPTNGLASSRSLLQLGDIAILTSAPEAFEPPHWINRAATDYLEAAIVPGVPGAAGAIVFAYDLAAAPFAAMVGSIEGKATKKKWESCLAALGEEYTNCQSGPALQRLLVEKLRVNGVSAASLTQDRQDL